MINTSLCTGCSACSIICPKKAIKIKLNDDGFYSPVIDEQKCIKCNLCDMVCIYNDLTFEENTTELAEKGLYMAYSNEKNNLSSSGGIAYEISKYFNEKLNYYICGVVYNRYLKCAQHTVIMPKKTSELHLLCGSKYLQSLCKESYENIINCEASVIFGLPCQIYGINRILKLRKQRERHLLVDFFCYGIPSYHLWFYYLDYLKKKFKVGENPEVIFRSNELGWNKRQIRIGNYKNDENRDLFYNFFCKEALCLNRTCYSCKFKNRTSADIRLGDFWGSKYKNSDIGHSMVSINTEKGESSINCIKDRVFIKEEQREDISVAQGYDCPKFPKKYNEILYDLKNKRPLFYILSKNFNILFEIKKYLRKIIYK